MAREVGLRALWRLQAYASRQTWTPVIGAGSQLSLGTALQSASTPRPSLLWLMHTRSYAVPPHTVMTMPSLSPTMTQGNIASWKKKEGDVVAPGQILAEIETDKATIEWEAMEEGFLAKILKGDGSKDIPIGEAVAILVEEEASVAAFKDYTGPSASPSKPAAAAAQPAAQPAAKPAAAAAAPRSSFPPHQVLNMPALSPTPDAHTGNILDWKKKVGDHVVPGDVFCDIETDKATIAWECQEEGFIAQILLAGGSKEVPIGTPGIVVVEDKESVDAFKNFTAADVKAGSKPAAPAAAPASSAEPAAAAPPPPTAAPAAPAAPGSRVIASPYAKKVAAQSGVSLSGLAGTGPGGRIVAADVQAAIAQGTNKAGPGAAAVGAAPQAPSDLSYVDIPHTQIRRVTANRLLESKQTIPHYYLTVEVHVDAMMKLREQVNASFPKDSGVKISVNDFVIKAAALALRKVPGVNASWQKDFIRQFNSVDISVAVQTPVGLLTPIVKDAHTKGLSGISSDVKTLAKKAKEGKLSPAEFMGGTFTISNLGMMGVKQFAAIVNPPQAAILAVGCTDKKVTMSKSGEFSESSVMMVTLSCDHRVIDGAMGAEWLQAFKSYLESPYTMLL